MKRSWNNFDGKNRNLDIILVSQNVMDTSYPVSLYQLYSVSNCN
jgi:hypothetical protein